jgi:WD40 repeat protein
MALKVFISYSRRDEHFMRAFLPHLALLESRGILDVSHDGDLEPGQRFEAELRRLVRSADLFVALLSVDYLLSPYCFEKELAWALERERAGALSVVPVLLRPCNWQSTIFASFQVIPRSGAYLTSAEDAEAAFHAACGELEALARSLAGTSGAPMVRRILTPRSSALVDVPPLPAHHVPQSEAQAIIEHCVREVNIENEALVGHRPATVALCGVGGVGKTSLAIAVARSERTIAHFHDGVVWINCGRTADIVGLQKRLLRASGYRGVVSDLWDDNKKALDEALDDVRMLVVVDDVWSSEQAGSLCGEYSRSTVLITTRHASIAREVNARVVPVAVPANALAIAMLASHSDQVFKEIPESAREIVRSCGYLPLAIAIMGSLIRTQAFGWGSLRTALKRSGQRQALMRIESPQADYRWHSVQAAFRASHESLGNDAARAFLLCRVFKRTTTFPRDVLIDLTWHIHAGDFSAYFAIEEELVARSLLTRTLGEGEEPRLTIHDLLVDYCAVEGGQDESADDVLVENLRERTSIGDELEAFRRALCMPYYEDELIRHLSASDSADRLEELMLDLGWLGLRLRTYGPSKLLADLGDAARTRALDELDDALSVCMHTLLRFPGELALQLEGRLSEATFAALGRVDASDDPRAGIGLRAMRRNFPARGGPVRRTIRVDGSSILSCFVDRERELVISLSLGGTLGITSLVSGESLLTWQVGRVRTTSTHWAAMSGPTVLCLADGAAYAVNLAELSIRDLGLEQGELRGISATGPSGRFIAWDDSAVYVLTVNDRLHSAECRPVTEGLRIEDGALDARGGVLVVADSVGVLMWGDVESFGAVHRQLGLNGAVRSVRLVNEATAVVLLYYSGDVALVDLDTPTIRWRRPIHTDWIECFTVDEETDILVTGGQDQQLVLTQLSDGQRLRRVREPSGYITAVHLSTGDDTHASNVVWSGPDAALRQERVHGTRGPSTSLAHSGRVNGIVPGPGPANLISWSDDGTIKLWDIDALATASSSSDHAASVGYVYAEAELVWTAAYDGTVSVWDPRSGEALAACTTAAHPIHAMTSAGQQRVLAGSEAGIVYALAYDDNARTISVEELHRCDGWIPAIVLTRVPTEVVIGDGSGRLTVLDHLSGRVVATSRPHDGAVRCLLLGPDSSVYSGAEDGRVAHSAIPALDVLCSAQVHDDWVNKLAASRSGGDIITVSDDYTLRVVDGRTLEESRPPQKHGAWAQDVVIRRSPGRAYSAGGDGRIYVQELCDAGIRRSWPAHDSWVSDLALTPDERFLISSSGDQVVKFWDLNDERLVASASIDTGMGPNALRLTKEGTLVVGGEDGKVFFLIVDRRGAQAE